MLGQGNITIVDPYGEIVAGPLIGAEGILYAAIDVDIAHHSRHQFDPVGPYARPDVFHLEVDTRPKIPVSSERSPSDSLNRGAESDALGSEEWISPPSVYSRRGHPDRVQLPRTHRPASAPRLSARLTTSVMASPWHAVESAAAIPALGALAERRRLRPVHIASGVPSPLWTSSLPLGQRSRRATGRPPTTASSPPDTTSPSRLTT